MAPSREQILEINSEQEDLARIGVSDASDIATVTIAGDDLAPAAPSGESAGQIPGGICVEWANPALNEDNSLCVDQRWAKIYYKSTTGVTKSVYDGTYVIAATQNTNSTFDDTVSVAVARYYIITAMDAAGNESDASGEVDSTGGGSGTIVDIPDDASSLIFDDSFGAGGEGIALGAGMLGIVFQQPAATWSGFDHYRLWFAVDTGGGFGAWTEITPVNRIGFIHKGLNTGHDYKYKAQIVANDGTNSTTADYATNNGNSGDGGAGYIPNASDNTLVFAATILAENLVVANEVRGEHFFAQSYLAINDDTFGNDGIQLQYNSGNPRGYIGNGVTGSSGRFFNFDGTNISWTGANTSLTAAGAFAASSATISGAITATSGTIAGFTVHATDGLYAGATTTRVQMKPGAGFWAGATAQASAPFRVSAAGALVATSATITGAITASSGAIGGFTIGASALTAGSGATAVGIAPASYPFYAGNATAASAPFRVSNAGALVATSATITGTITIGAGSSYAGNSIGTTYTAAKCTDAAADQTSAHTAAAIAGQGDLATQDTVGATDCNATIISGGKIITGLLSATNIQTGTLTGLVVRTAASGARAEIHVAAPSHSLVIYDSSGETRASAGFGGFAVRNTSGGITGYFKCEDNNYPQIYLGGTQANVSVSQDASGGALEPLTLVQADISEGFIDFGGSDRGVIAGATNSLKSVRVELNGTVYRLALYVDA